VNATVDRIAEEKSKQLVPKIGVALIGDVNTLLRKQVYGAFPPGNLHVHALIQHIVCEREGSNSL
jgi:hypothetical protein